MVVIGVLSLGLLVVRVLNSGPEMGRGSPERAAKWRAVFEGLSDPETVKTRYPFAATKRFDDGSWIFGAGEDSHGDREGGTIVVKDSDGRIRAFFGHVCGPGLLESALTQSASRAEFYGLLSRSTFKFTVYRFP
jgi:hypothetical protein